ncbi:MAG: DUF4331 family protein [Acidobacteriota bacterium]
MQYARRTLVMAVVLAIGILSPNPSSSADHNDPNAVNSTFAGVPQDAADLYDLYGFPVDDGRRLVLALTFAAVPRAGVFDTDMLYRVLVAPNPRVAPPLSGDRSLTGVLDYFDAVKNKYLRLKPSEIRVRFESPTRARIDFIDFPSGSTTQVIEVDSARTLRAPDGSDLRVFVGGRDDAFFNDLPGFFRSINYAPQFYRVPQAMTDARELKIPKTLIELEGNTLFNFDAGNPRHGQGVKLDLPPASQLTWTGNRYAKNANGNYRFVYSGKDAQAGQNINAIVLDLPLSYLTRSPDADRIVNAWGESWVRTASGKIDTIPADGATLPGSFWLEHAWLVGGLLIGAGVVWLLSAILRRGVTVSRSGRILHALAGVLVIAAGITLALLYQVRPGQQAALAQASQADELKSYKLIDTDGQPFADAGLNERENGRQVGPNSLVLGPLFVRRLAHLGWGFGPSVSALGLRGSFNHDDSPVSVYRTYDSVIEAFPRVAHMLFQPMTMPDESWHTHQDVNIAVRRAFEVFVPNVAAIDMDTNGSWPYGRRLDDQVATRFLSIFLDMEPGPDGTRYNIDTLADQAALDTLPMEPRVPPNPLKNDKEFLTSFPYLAEPWPTDYTPGPR